MNPARTDGGPVSGPVSKSSRDVLPPPTGEQKFHLDFDEAARPALQLAADLLAHDVLDLGRVLHADPGAELVERIRRMVPAEAA